MGTVETIVCVCNCNSCKLSSGGGFCAHMCTYMYRCDVILLSHGAFGNECSDSIGWAILCFLNSTELGRLLSDIHTYMCII